MKKNNKQKGFIETIALMGLLSTFIGFSAVGAIFVETYNDSEKTQTQLQEVKKSSVNENHE